MARAAASIEKKRKCRLGEVIRKRKERRVKSWNDSLQLMESLAGGLQGDHGRSRIFKENCCYILAIKACLKRKLIANDTTINWNSIET